MALTFRTGSGGKGSALTIDELDNNFRHFTGSHEINGSLTVSGSIIPSKADATLGTLDNPWKDLYVSDSSIIFVSSSTTSSFGVNSSGSLSGAFDGSLSGSFTGSGEGDFTGSFSGSVDGSLSGSFTGSGEGDFAGSFSGSVDTQFNSGSCLIGCTSSVVPSYSASEGTFVFVATGSNHFIYAYVGGSWKSGSLV